MTIQQILSQSVEIISNIHVPVAFTDEIAVPMSRVMRNLNAVLQAIQEDEARKAQEEVEKQAEEATQDEGNQDDGGTDRLPAGDRGDAGELPAE